MNRKITIRTIAVFMAVFSLMIPITIPSAWAGVPVCATPPPGMIGWWAGDGDATDLIGDNDGILIADATFDAGKVGFAFSLDGFGDSVEIPDLDNSLDTGTSFTIDTWFKTDDVNQVDSGNTNQKTQSIVMYGYSNSEGKNNALVIRNALFEFNVRDGDGTEDVVGTTVLTSNTWYHGAYTYDGDTTTGTLYLDGQVEATDNTTNINLDANSRVIIGGYQDPGSLQINFDFVGMIDEVEIFDRALSQGEIQNIFNAGMAGKCKLDTTLMCGTGTTLNIDTNECEPNCGAGTTLIGNECKADVTQADLDILQDIIDNLNNIVIPALEATIAQLQSIITGTSNVEICHKPGTTQETTLQISVQQLQGHLNHGDAFGECVP